MRVIGFIILNIAFLASLFSWQGAEATNNVTALGLMVLLATLFADLKKFNFWGLTGEKEERELRQLLEEETVSVNVPKAPPKPKPTVVSKAEQRTSLQLLDTSPGNFLTLAFEIERLLRIAGTILLDNQNLQNSFNTIVNELHQKHLLTDAGVKQIEAIRRLRNTLVHDGGDEINDQVLKTGLNLAMTVYNELKNWLGE